jgi:hypothetical protein
MVTAALVAGHHRPTSLGQPQSVGQLALQPRRACATTPSPTSSDDKTRTASRMLRFGSALCCGKACLDDHSSLATEALTVIYTAVSPNNYRKIRVKTTLNAACQTPLTVANHIHDDFHHRTDAEVAALEGFRKSLDDAASFPDFRRGQTRGEAQRPRDLDGLMGDKNRSAGVKLWTGCRARIAGNRFLVALNIKSWIISPEILAEVRTRPNGLLDVRSSATARGTTVPSPRLLRG